MHKTINHNDYVFEVDYEHNIEYYLSNGLCDCAPDRNYYEIIGKYHPKIVDFLARFGVDATRPDEVSWLEQDVTKQTVFFMKLCIRLRVKLQEAIFLNMAKLK